jgi:hypothetical protein
MFVAESKGQLRPVRLCFAAVVNCDMPVKDENLTFFDLDLVQTTTNCRLSISLLTMDTLLEGLQIGVLQ